MAGSQRRPRRSCSCWEFWEFAFRWYFIDLVFLKVAQDNIARIWDSPDRACLFSFQAWRGYLIIAVMIPLGLLLRNSPLPKPYLAVLYTAIGGGLFLASFHYYAFFYRVVWRGQAMSEE